MSTAAPKVDRKPSKALDRQKSVAPAFTIKLYIHKKLHTSIIGKGGSTVKEIQADHQVKVKLPQRDDYSHLVEISGDAANVKAARAEIEGILGAKASEEPFLRFEMQVEKKRHGAVIGRGGANLRQMETDSGCIITVPTSDSESDLVIVEGSKDGANIVKEAVQKLLSVDLVLKHVQQPTPTAATGGAEAKSTTEGSKSPGSPATKPASPPSKSPEPGATASATGTKQGEPEAKNTATTASKENGSASAKQSTSTPAATTSTTASTSATAQQNGNAGSADTRAPSKSVTAASIVGSKAPVSRTSSATSPPSGGAPAKTESKSASGQCIFYVPKKAQFELIGPGGRTIKRLQDSTGVTLRIPKLEDPSTEVVVVGPASKCEDARKEMSKLVGFEVGATPLERVYLDIPNVHWKDLIGTEGNIVRGLEAKCACNIYIPRKTDTLQYIEVEGSKAAIAKATQEMEAIVKHKIKVVTNVKQETAAAPAALNLDFSKPINEALFFPDADLADGWNFNRFLGFLGSATQSMDICVFTITDGRITSVLRNAHQRGVKIRVITDNDTSTNEGSDIEALQKMGAEVKFDTTEFHMHHKFTVIDRKLVITGSYNWTKSASVNNQENMIVTNQGDLVKDFINHFEKMWSDDKNFSKKLVQTANAKKSGK